MLVASSGVVTWNCGMSKMVEKRAEKAMEGLVVGRKRVHWSASMFGRSAGVTRLHEMEISCILQLRL